LTSREPIGRTLITAALHRPPKRGNSNQRVTQQAFLEAHEQAFHYFGGIFRLLRYDNLMSAVKKILQGHRREETTRFIAFRSHWRFASDFCNPREPHEKGGIEGEAGFFRRNHWVPLPQARDLDDLNAQLLAACHEDERRQIAGHALSVGAAMIAERAHLLPLAEQNFELAEIAFPRVDGLGCVRVRTNLYSAPAPPGRTVEVGSIRARSKYAMRAAASRAMSAATSATSRCSISNIISMCSNASRAR
jgi:hypothetical protein